MSYPKALEAAGAKILDYEEFGSYQGTWFAFVEYQGRRGIIEGSFGSCSGCDSYLSQFDFRDEPTEKDGKFYKEYWCDNEITKEEFDELNAAMQKELADFGADYLKDIQESEIIKTRISNMNKEDWFDSEEMEGLEWALKKLTSENLNSEKGR